MKDMISCLMLLVVVCHSWKMPFNRYSTIRSRRNSFVARSSSPADIIDTEMVKDVKTNPEVANENSESSKEELFKVYPFANLSLPLLMDRDNYWSGKFGDMFWHQNRDHVNVFIPVDESVPKSDISVSIEPFSVQIYIANKLLTQFVCPYAIGPTSSFWVFERDINDQRYILLDLEKRVGYVNWLNLFEHKQKKPGDVSAMLDVEKAQLLERLFQANQGLAKLKGEGAPQSVDEMLNDPDLMKAISTKIDPEDVAMMNIKDGKVTLVPKGEITDKTMAFDPLATIEANDKNN